VCEEIVMYINYLFAVRRVNLCCLWKYSKGEAFLTNNILRLWIKSSGEVALCSVT